MSRGRRKRSLWKQKDFDLRSKGEELLKEVFHGDKRVLLENEKDRTECKLINGFI